MQDRPRLSRLPNHRWGGIPEATAALKWASKDLEKVPASVARCRRTPPKAA